MHSLVPLSLAAWTVAVFYVGMGQILELEPITPKVRLASQMGHLLGAGVSETADNRNFVAEQRSTPNGAQVRATKAPTNLLAASGWQMAGGETEFGASRWPGGDQQAAASPDDLRVRATKPPTDLLATAGWQEEGGDTTGFDAARPQGGGQQAAASQDPVAVRATQPPTDLLGGWPAQDSGVGASSPVIRTAAAPSRGGVATRRHRDTEAQMAGGPSDNDAVRPEPVELQVAALPDDTFTGLSALGDGELSELRGGLNLGGMIIDFAAQVTAEENGSVVLDTLLHFPASPTAALVVNGVEVQNLGPAPSVTSVDGGVLISVGDVINSPQVLANFPGGNTTVLNSVSDVGFTVSNTLTINIGNVSSLFDGGVSPAVRNIANTLNRSILP